MVVVPSLLLCLVFSRNYFCFSVLVDWLLLLFSFRGGSAAWLVGAFCLFSSLCFPFRGCCFVVVAALSVLLLLRPLLSLCCCCCCGC